MQDLCLVLCFCHFKYSSFVCVYRFNILLDVLHVVLILSMRSVDAPQSRKFGEENEILPQIQTQEHVM